MPDISHRTLEFPTGDEGRTRMDVVISSPRPSDAQQIAPTAASIDALKNLNGVTIGRENEGNRYSFPSRHD